MKKSLIALAVLAASGVASAQSSLTIYGIADVWVGGIKNAGITNAVVNSGGVSDSRFGFKGVEDLGGGLKANFVLEQGFNVDNGTQDVAGQAFSRQAYVGFSGGFGEVRLGKTLTPFDDLNPLAIAAFESDLNPTKYTWRSTANFGFVNGGFNSSPANTVYYATPNVSGFSGAASYSFGEDKSAVNKASRTSSFSVTYEGGPVAVGLGYQAQKSTGQLVTEKFLRLSGTYNFGVAKLLAAYGNVNDVGNVDGQKTKEWQLGVDVPVSSALTLSGGYARSKDNAALGDAKRSGFGVAANYSLSKRTSVYGGVNTTKFEDAAGNQTNKLNAYGVGVRHTF